VFVIVLGSGVERVDLNALAEAARPRRLSPAKRRLRTWGRGALAASVWIVLVQNPDQSILAAKRHKKHKSSIAEVAELGRSIGNPRWHLSP
jgi:hypothetical protein